MDVNRLKDNLDYLIEVCPNNVFGKLVEGALIGKVNGIFSDSNSMFYEIDDVDIYMKIDEVYSAFKHDGSESVDFLKKNSMEKDGKKVLPFSKVIENGVGECLEKSILVQLSAQKKRDVYLINGSFSEGDDFLSGHAYNVLFKNDKALLVDVTNPITIDGALRYFIEPIVDITKDGCFVLENNLDERNYFIR